MVSLALTHLLASGGLVLLTPPSTAGVVINRAIYNCPITNPTSTTIWKAGEKALVAWDTHGLPKNTTLRGKLELGHFQLNATSEHLDRKHPLAEGFNLSDGKTSITVPQVASGTQYIVVLFGDSGNRSPTFTIDSAPVQPVKLLAWSSTITSPKADDVWLNGCTQNVTWLLDDIPNEKNSTGLLL